MHARLLTLALPSFGNVADMTPAEASCAIIQLNARMARERRSLLERVVPDAKAADWTHYPAKDARDARCRSRWYYHVHSSEGRKEERQGHFHLFLHRTQLSGGAEPKVWPPQREQCKAHVAHIAALSVDDAGRPTSWFAVNRFVTNEFLYPAEVMIRHLPDFNVEHTSQDPTVNRYLTAMVALYREEIAALLHERDAQQATLQARLGPDAYEKPSGVEVLARTPIDLEAKLAEATALVPSLVPLKSETRHCLAGR